jgi:prolyl-tRNA editing enzyme YbaK/EbsC (Cys-tRNA(Pro) deacylase)
MKTIVDSSLKDDLEIVFQSNTHDEAVRMKFADFVQLEDPLVASFAL